MKKHLLLASLISMLAVPASAEGFYILGDLGQTKLEADLGDHVYFHDTDTSIGIGGGFGFNQYVALEVAYHDLGSTSSGNINDDFYSKSDLTAFQVSVLGKLPISDVVDVYGRLGVGKLKRKTTYTETYGYYIPNLGYTTFTDSGSESDSDNKAFFGIGASYNITESFALRTEYNKFDRWNDAVVSRLSVGASYSF
ncbi:MAG TPA: porin family protein [Cellvibrio sp.]|nr:porin family protein [Cellvibrio sp.]